MADSDTIVLKRSVGQKGLHALAAVLPVPFLLVFVAMGGFASYGLGRALGLTEDLAIALGGAGFMVLAALVVAVAVRSYLDSIREVRLHRDRVEVAFPRRVEVWPHAELAEVRIVDLAAERLGHLWLVDRTGRRRKIHALATTCAWLTALVTSAGPSLADRFEDEIRRGGSVTFSEPRWRRVRTLLGSLLLIGLGATMLVFWILASLERGFQPRGVLSILLLASGVGLLRRLLATGSGLVATPGGIRDLATDRHVPWDSITGWEQRLDGLVLAGGPGGCLRLSPCAVNAVALPSLIDRFVPEPSEESGHR